MNIRTMIFSGIMTALIGLMLGLAVNEISQRHRRKTVVMTTGAVLGFVIGFAYQGIKQEKDLRDDYEQSPEEQKSDP